MEARRGEGEAGQVFDQAEGREHLLRRQRREGSEKVQRRRDSAEKVQRRGDSAEKVPRRLRDGSRRVAERPLGWARGRGRGACWPRGVNTVAVSASRTPLRRKRPAAGAAAGKAEERREAKRSPIGTG